ncbi:four helix bundle protein [Herpetosiphon llansteffanensis]
MAIRSFKDLEVWQKAMDLAANVYAVTQTMPPEERFGLTNQVRRAVTSIPANIAEGHGRLYQAEYIRFLSIARGSLMEVETHILLAERLGFLQPDQLFETKGLIGQVGRLINGLLRSLRANQATGRISETGIDYQSDPQSPTPDPHIHKGVFNDE